ncbi:hypothetical protein GBA52_015126 [Prunus armeniaca]|nr:hypothetical protein GBA52_015126 [Prunus armeniaca]
MALPLLPPTYLAQHPLFDQTELTIPIQVLVLCRDEPNRAQALASTVTYDIRHCLKGIVTRRPLVLQLHKANKGTKEYIEFLHLPFGYRARRKDTYTQMQLDEVREELATHVLDGYDESDINSIQN